MTDLKRADRRAWVGCVRLCGRGVIYVKVTRWCHHVVKVLPPLAVRIARAWR